MADQYPPMSRFATAFAAEFKGFMRAAGVTGAELAEALGRNAGYVSERVNGKRAVDTNDIDALAELATGWTGKTLMAELARRARETSDAATQQHHALVANETINEYPAGDDADFDTA